MMDVYKGFFENFFIKPLACSYNQCRYEWGNENSKYSFYKLYYYIDGESRLIIDGIDLSPKSGDLVLIPANVVHTYSQNLNNRVIQYWCHFELNLLSGRRIVYNKDTVMCNISRDIVEPLFDRLINSWSQNSTLSRIAEKSALLDLLYLFLDNIDYNRLLYTDSEYDNVLIHNYILDNLNEDISLNELANLIPLHPNYFITYFKKHFETTPIDYINTLRLRKSTILLESETNLSITQIAELVGFKDYRYFSRIFKKKYTITPSTYRTIMKNKVVI